MLGADGFAVGGTEVLEADEFAGGGFERASLDLYERAEGLFTYAMYG